MNLIRLINILRGGIPKFYFNLKNLLWSYFSGNSGSKESSPSKSVLLIRSDGIGDFIQWLPCAEKISSYYKNSGFTITILGNSAWLEYSRNFSLFDYYYEFNRALFIKSAKYRKGLIEKLNVTYYNTIIYLSPEREFIIDVSLVRLLSAATKTGFKGDAANDGFLWLLLGNSYYTKLIDISNREKYEPDINNFFLERLNIETPEINLPEIDIVDRTIFKRERDYFILIPGSNMNIKQWDFQNFIEIARRIFEKTNYECIICGGKKELNILIANKKKINFEYINLVDKTSLLELTQLISNAKFLVSNDTGAVHIATGLNVPSFCIYGGGHFGRFLPYKDKGINGRVLPDAIYHKMECFNCNWKCKYQITKSKPARCIENVSVEQVWNEIDKWLEKN